MRAKGKGEAPKRLPGSHGAVKPRPAGTLKAAVLELVDAVGGHVRAAEIVETSKGHVQRWTDPDGESAGVLPSVGKIRLLERAAGEPVVTRFLAAEAGHALMPMGQSTAETIAVLLALSAGEIADVLRAGAEAMRDGHVSRREAVEMLPEIDQAMRALGALRGYIAGLRDAPAVTRG